MTPRAAAFALLKARAPEASVCPSEVARSVADASASEGWRSLMPAVHAAIDELIAEGVVELSWKGQHLDKRAGPYRIRSRRVARGD